MATEPLTIADALKRVRDRVDAACRRADRDPGDVRLIVVSKTVEPDRIRELLRAGHRCLGENRVQEALTKQDVLDDSVEWHFIGTLQRNKARHVVGRFALIHSVDDARLAAELDRRAAVAGVRQPVLIQVNLSLETTKGGVHEAGLPALLEHIEGLEHLDLRGLMTVPPPVERAGDAAPWFRRLRDLGQQGAARLGRPLPELSMGMTDDFEVAIEEGATWVRVGRAIFGERPPA